jgi:hypothetical protein
MDETGERTAGPRSGDPAGETRDWSAAAEESLRGLEARLAKASEAAERLMREAAERVGDERPPEAGWQAPGTDSPRGILRLEDLELLGTILDRVRDLIPPELQRRLAEAFRELLLALRALIDWYLERVEQRRASPPKVSDIPIE